MGRALYRCLNWRAPRRPRGLCSGPRSWSAVLVVDRLGGGGGGARACERFMYGVGLRGGPVTPVRYCESLPPTPPPPPSYPPSVASLYNDDLLLSPTPTPSHHRSTPLPHSPTPHPPPPTDPTPFLASQSPHPSLFFFRLQGQQLIWTYMAAALALSS